MEKTENTSKGIIGEKFEKLYHIEKELRINCPWDRELTSKDSIRDIKEEVQEIIEALNNHDIENLKEEIGDVLSALIMLSIINEDHFTISDSITEVTEKMIRRHPHVFGELKGQNLSKEEILKNWKKIKEKEKEIKAKNNPNNYSKE